MVFYIMRAPFNGVLYNARTINRKMCDLLTHYAGIRRLDGIRGREASDRAVPHGVGLPVRVHLRSLRANHADVPELTWEESVHSVLQLNTALLQHRTGGTYNLSHVLR